MTSTRRIEPGARASRILHRDTVQVLAAPIQVGGSVPDEDALPVELIREGDVIRQIRVVCPCGETMILDCQYPGEAGPV